MGASSAPFFLFPVILRTRVRITVLLAAYCWEHALLFFLGAAAPAPAPAPAPALVGPADVGSGDVPDDLVVVAPRVLSGETEDSPDREPASSAVARRTRAWPI